jgi:hypothetical protein
VYLLCNAVACFLSKSERRFADVVLIETIFTVSTGIFLRERKKPFSFQEELLLVFIAEKDT